MRSYVIVASFLAIIICLPACQKEPGNNGMIPGSTARDSTITDTTYFIDFTLNGKRVFQIASNVEGWTWTHPWFMLGDTSIYPYSSLQTEFDYSWQPSIFGFYFSKNQYGLDVSAYASHDPTLLKTTFIDSFFKAGNYSYAKLMGNDTTYTSVLNPDPETPRTQHLLGDGIHLIWFDSTGKSWQTCKGTANQTGSFFTITKNEVIPFTIVPGYSDYADRTWISANFECNLYDAMGNSLHLANGRFRLLLRFKQFN